MLLSNDVEDTKKVIFNYCTISCLSITSVILICHRTSAYLLFGSLKILPLLLLLIVFEIVKWFFKVVILEKDNNSVKKVPALSVLKRTLKSSDFVRGFITILICLIAFYLIAILFGAQILSNQEETLMFSALMTILTAVPISFQCGSTYVEYFVQRVRPSNMLHSLLYYNSQITLLGAWLGAFVIPLDWDRPWQVWPIPCSLGALIGYCVSNYIHLIAIFFGKLEKLKLP